MSDLYKPNAKLFIEGVEYLVCLRKKDERNLAVREAGTYGQRFRLQGNCVKPYKFPLTIQAPLRAPIVVDPGNSDFSSVRPGDDGSIVGDFILDEWHRTRWKEIECTIGQRFEGYIIPRRNTNAFIDPLLDSENVEEINEDDWE
jgi:hypothetical protein